MDVIADMHGTLSAKEISPGEGPDELVKVTSTF